MKKTLLFSGIAMGLCALNAGAFELHPYISAKANYVDMKPTITTGGSSFSIGNGAFGGSFALGISPSCFEHRFMRLEAEYNINSSPKRRFLLDPTASSVGDFKTETQSIMINAYYDIHNRTHLTPYMFAGLGGAYVKVKANIDGTNDSVSRTNLAWQVGFGASYDIMDCFDIDAGYKYVSYGNFQKNDALIDTYAHEIYLGARYVF